MLVDTYDTLAGVRHAAAIEPAIRAIRLDSGDPLELSYQSRAILDELGRHEVKIFASGDLEEFEIARLVRNEAPIDAFGVGTELITSKDAPALSLVYKLVELNGVGRIKLSPSKKTYPMAKQVFRSRDAAGRFAGDLVTRADEAAEGEPLLVPVVREGKLVAPLPRLDAIQDHCRASSSPCPIGFLGPRPSRITRFPTATPLRPRPIAWGSTDMHPAMFLHGGGRPCHRLWASRLGVAGRTLIGMRMNGVAWTPERIV